MRQMSDGKFGIQELLPGFGLTIDTERLKERSDNYYLVKQ